MRHTTKICVFFGIALAALASLSFGADETNELQRDYNVTPVPFSHVEFAPVSTFAIKLEVVLQKEWSAGIQEVVIE